MADDVRIKFSADASEVQAVVKDLGSTMQSGLAGANDALGKFGAQSAEAAKSVLANAAAMGEGASGASILTQAVNGVGSSLSAVGGPAGVAAAAVAGIAAAMVGAAQSAMNYEKSIHQFAVATGSSLAQASVFSTALALIGKSAEETEAMMFRLMRTLRTQPEILAQIGVAAQNLDGSFRPMTDIFFDAIKALQGYREGLDRDTAAITLFGRGAKEATEYLRLNAAMMAEAAEIANTWGLTVDERGVMSAREYSKALNTLALEFKGVGLAIGKEVMPVLSELVRDINHAASEAATFGTATGKLATNLSELGLIFVGISTVIKMAVASVQLMWAAFTTLRDAGVILGLALKDLTVTMAKLFYYFTTFNISGFVSTFKKGLDDIKNDTEATAKSIEERWQKLSDKLAESLFQRPKPTSGGEPTGEGFIGPPAPGSARGDGGTFDPTYYKREKDALDQYIAQEKATHTVSLQEQRDYWEKRKNIVIAGATDVNPIFKKAAEDQKAAEEQAAAYGGLDSGRIAALQKAVDAQVEIEKTGNKEKIASAEAAVQEIVGVDITGNNKKLAGAMHTVSQMKAQNEQYTASYRQITAELASIDVALQKQKLTHIEQAGSAQVDALRQQQLAANQSGTRWLDNITKVVPALDGVIKKYSELYGVSEQVVRAVLEVERGLKANGEFAVSSKGAIGPGQLMPQTAQNLGVDPWNLDQNIKGSVKLLAELFQKFPNDLAKVFAAYNAGEGAVKAKGTAAAEPGYVDKAMGAMGAGSAQVPILSQQVKLEQELAATEAELTAKQNERKAVQDKLTQDPGNEEYIAKLGQLNAAITSLQTRELAEKQSIEKEKLNLIIRALDDEQAKHKKGSEDYLTIERQKFAEVARLYAAGTETYMAARQQLNAAERVAGQERVKIAKETDGMVIDSKKAAIDQEKAMVEQSYRLGLITAAQKTMAFQQLDAQLYQDKLAISRKEVQDAIDTYGQISEQATKAYRKLLDLQQNYASQVQNSNNQLVMDYVQRWQSAFQTVASSFASAMQGIITGTMNLQRAVTQVFNAILGFILQTIAKWVAEHLAALVGITLAHQAQQITITTTTAAGETVRSTITMGAAAKDIALTATKTTAAVTAETAKTTAVMTGCAARSAAEATSASTGMFAQVGAAISSIMASAAKTFAGIFGFLSPIMGPAAVGPAAAGEASVMAATSLVAFDLGAWNIPKTMLGVLHPGEMIVPERFAEGYRNAAGGGAELGGGRGGGEMHAHFHFANDTQAFEQQLKTANSPLMKQVKKSIRDGHLRLR
jgi:hypothetical protein